LNIFLVSWEKMGVGCWLLAVNFSLRSIRGKNQSEAMEANAS